MNTIKLLRSHNAVIVVLVVALFAQMPHAQAVFYEHGRTHDWLGAIFSLCAAVALEIAVLVFVVRGNIYASWGFAAFSIAINLVYYANAQTVWYMPDPSWLLSAGLPVAIALYSHEVADRGEGLQLAEQPIAVVKPLQVAAQPTIARAPKAQVVATVDDRVRVLQLKSEGLSNAKIANELQVNISTVGRWLKKELQ